MNTHTEVSDCMVENGSPPAEFQVESNHVAVSLHPRDMSLP
jgi:hypothetical protein